MRKFKDNVCKCKVVRCSRYVNIGWMVVRLNGEPSEEVIVLSPWCRKWQQMEDVKGMLYKEWTLSIKRGECLKVSWIAEDRVNTNKCLYEGVIVPTELYGAETWSIRSAERRKVDVFEIKYLRSLAEVSRMDRVMNEEVHRRAGIKKWLASRVDEWVLRWFGHGESMNEYRMATRVLMAAVSGGRVLGRPRLGSMNGVTVALSSRGMTVEAARQWARDRNEWRALVHIKMIHDWVRLCHFWFIPV